jgi:Na+-translocating ferredoxin:NAD+ oxidoreductase RNF subunit RnfB
MDTVMIAIISVTGIGAACAAVLCVASKFMFVKADERVARLQECLPGSNCGACGFPGCAGYAAALIADSNISSNLCTPGGAVVLRQLSDILGVEAGDVAVKFAVVRCRGSRGTQQTKMEYKGIETCMAAKPVFGGGGACAFGCLGYGDCGAVCPADAICMEDGLARIDKRHCTGCGLCVKACPNKLITVEDASIPVAVLCENTEKGAVVRKKCENGCIACRKCARECPSEAIIVEDNLAVIDYEKCTCCGHCAEICITKCIQPFAASKAGTAEALFHPAMM